MHGSALPLPQSSLGSSRATSISVGLGGTGPRATEEKVLMGSASVRTQGGALSIIQLSLSLFKGLDKILAE